MSKQEYAALVAVYEAAKELHLLEDFEEMPCQHACCAPLDWDAYQGARHALYDALERVARARAEREVSQ